MTYNIIGLMSGTSLDGLDVAYCKFDFQGSKWSYKILASKTFEYNLELKKELRNVEKTSAINFIKTDLKLGEHFGNCVNQFVDFFKIKKSEIDAVSSHGHTIFHQPHLGFSTQIGNGAHICAITKLKTIVDFRSLDVALGGEGAPLVPVGDQLLFNEYDFCLNLGGIANISSNKNGVRQAKDITFANMVGNYICEEIGITFDKGGGIAKTGHLDQDLLSFLNKITIDNNNSGKSLGKETFVEFIIPYLNQSKITIENKLHTLGKHIAIAIKQNVKKDSELLITGGGAYNDFWISQIEKETRTNVTIPSSEIIEFKEALIFAFLGVLRLENHNSCLKSVTKARKDNIGGAVYVY